MDARGRGLYSSLVFRLDALDQNIQAIRSQRTAGRVGVRRALDMISLYPKWIRGFVDAAVKRTKDDAALDNLLGLIGLDVVFKTQLVEVWFAEGSSREIPLSLAEAVERECVASGVGRRQAVLAIGRADNFGTFPYDLDDYLYGNPAITRPRPSKLRPDEFAMVQVPRLEGGRGLWWPIVVGHELAHLAAKHHASVASLNLAKQIDWSKFSILPKDRPKFLEMAENWATELICDAYSALRFGPAGVASAVQLLDHLGATEKPSQTHPPGWLRFRLLRRWVGDLKGSVTESVLAHCDEICASPMPSLNSDLTELMTLLESLSDELINVVRTWGAVAYQSADHEARIQAAIDDFEHGIPSRVEVKARDGKAMSEEDCINAGWVLWTRQSKWPIPKLLGKSIDNLHFLRQWNEAGGKTETEPPKVPSKPPAGVLSGQSIVKRLRLGWSDPDPLVVTPLLAEAVGTGSLDVRLGPQFIVFERTETASIKTFNPGWDPREVQRLVEVGWGERFVLHPNELVLASTLEYLALPGDLSAQVITRSTYGRMGLITATAVQVHPYYHGCLTLELLNLGLVPLELMPGERIAQLIFVKVQPKAPRPKKKSFECPVGPEISRPLKQTGEAATLSKIIKRAESRGKA